MAHKAGPNIAIQCQESYRGGMTEPHMSLAEARSLIGVEACRAAADLAAVAPPFGPRLEAELATLLRHDQPAGEVDAA